MKEGRVFGVPDERLSFMNERMNKEFPTTGIASFFPDNGVVPTSRFNPFKGMYRVEGGMVYESWSLFGIPVGVQVRRDRNDFGRVDLVRFMGIPIYYRW